MLNRNDFFKYYTAYMFPMVAQGSEGTIFSYYAGVFKVFFDGTSTEVLNEKLEILELLNDLDFQKKYPNIIVADELLFDGNTFRGYTMAEAPGKSFAYAVRDKDAFKILNLAKEIESLLKILHKNGIYVRDLSASNIFVDDKDSVYLIDVDSFCNGESKRTRNTLLKYPCPYTRIISKKSDLFALRMLIIIALTGESFRSCTSSPFDRIRLRRKLEGINMPEHIKKQLLETFSKKGFKNIDYMF